jgi:hypothetical protein
LVSDEFLENMNGKLFTQDFLQDGITQTARWLSVDATTLESFRKRLLDATKPFKPGKHFDEAVTETQLILPILAAVGWHDSLPQQTTAKRGRTDVPDILLFASADNRAAALSEKEAAKRYRHGLLVCESKRWERALDRGETTDPLDAGTPSNQMLRYLSSVEVASDKRMQWGVLTNGRIWRLYWQGAQSRSEDFLEIDLAHALPLPGSQAELSPVFSSEHTLKLFLVLFGKAAFQPMPADESRRTLLAYALEEGQKWQAKVSGDLGERVFKEVFPRLANAVAHSDREAPSPFTPAYLAEVRDATLILLYRLLFIFYAEDRALLPVSHKGYDDYSLTKLRQSLARHIDEGDVFSERMTRMWDDLSRLFGAISQGDASLALPAYNGGLFEASTDSLVRRASIPDAMLAPILDLLSRRDDSDSKRWINYRDLNVQHLGSVYERLLDYSLVVQDNTVVAAPQSFARRVTGSYYTHDDLVKLIIRTTLMPLIDERLAKFDEACKQTDNKRALSVTDIDYLARFDPASAILSLKICDPAMGSGHFLVALVDYLADKTLEAIASATARAGHSEAYQSPVLKSIADIRERILASAAEQGWPVTREQLDDRHLIRRMILKRVIFGADKNPMAVELAKVALWLHTFTVGAPLSFLDHHLRCGDSLHGENAAAALKDMRKISSVLQEHELTALDAATSAMEQIAALTDIDVAEAHRSKELLTEIDAQLAPLKAILDFWRALRWMIPGWDASKFQSRKFQTNPLAPALGEVFAGHRPLQEMLLNGRVRINDDPPKTKQEHARLAAESLIRAAKSLVEREHFMHWSLAFPTVWASAREEERGFDAVIGNPPWDRMKMQEVEWFAEREPDIAKAARASDRKKMIDVLKKKRQPLWNDYEAASEAAETAARVVRECGDYPLLSGGDVNLYSLFVERAASITAPHGIIGLLTPSGIAADKNAAEFFKSISQTGRLGALYDFENRKTFFPDVHASFKFSALVFGSNARLFEATSCAFYLHRVDDLRDADRVLNLTAADFSSVNPNTGGAPIFRSRRDAEITTRIYREFPVLVDHRSGTPRKVWPVRYQRMFDMTNDSNLFMRRDEMQKDGWYPVAGNRWKKGEAEAVPLYEGKMVQMYDHRAANVVMNMENLHRAAQQEAASLEAHEDPKFSPEPQFFVKEADVDHVSTATWSFAYKSVTAPTNARTMIGALLPKAGVGNSMAILARDVDDVVPKDWLPLLVANLLSTPLDFVLRQKVQGQNLNWFIVEQLPMIPPAAFEAKLGKHIVADFIRGEVLRLTYTANDMQAFASDMGYGGAPFVWDEDDRRHRTARLDALFFHLYGIDRDDADYILNTFTIVREQDEKAHGRFLTRDLVLAYMNAVAAGDLTSVVSV